MNVAFKVVVAGHILETQAVKFFPDDWSAPQAQPIVLAEIKTHENTFLWPAMQKNMEDHAKERSRLLHGFLQKDSIEKPGISSSGHQPGSVLQCGITSRVDAHTDEYGLCPESCPYFAQNHEDSHFCSFVCVPAEDCGKWDPQKPIADTSKRNCRAPMVSFCSEPDLDGMDTCSQCQWGFKRLDLDGQCYFQHWTAVFVGTAIVFTIMTLVVVWLVDLCCRETMNGEEVRTAEKFRDRAKVLMPKSAVGRRRPWPLSTNLCKADVAGVGMLLHFNFQAFLIFWPLVIALLWTILACFHNELWILGTRSFGTPRDNCILVAWGYETTQRLKWTNVGFLLVVYLFSFISFLLFSVHQHRLYQTKASSATTMKKFALELKGLPALHGLPHVEADIQRAVQSATGQNIVGVSVCWNYVQDEDSIMKAVKEDQDERAMQVGSPRKPRWEVPEPTANMGFVHKNMYKIEEAFFGPSKENEVPEREVPPSDGCDGFVTEMTLKLILRQMLSTDTAFVVFNTAEDANEALARIEDRGIAFMGRTLTLLPAKVEPTTVNWQNCGNSATGAMLLRGLRGFFTIYLPALAIWFFAFYAPYALSVHMFNHDNGAELPWYYSMAFMIIVVGGNANMYRVCDTISDKVRFKHKDTKQCVYMLMYLFACMVNVFLHMSVTYYTSLKMMVDLDFRTSDGTQLQDIDAFTDQFETYSMQRSLGGNMYAYAFPSTFLIPFLIEPFVTVVVPFQLGKLVIRTHREVQGTRAESWIAAYEFDLGRYADILLNVFLGTLIFFFPGGYTWSLFYGMFISHIVIYLFDHWRVLDVIPNIKLTSFRVDWWAQVMLVVCCSMIMSALVFKANCETYVGYCIKDMNLVYAMGLAGVAHFIIHMLLLIYLVPAVATWAKGEDVKDKHEDVKVLLGQQVKVLHEDVKYATVAKDDPYTWFSVNPVHCLRSKLIHKHRPHCRFVSPGKEHFLEVNEEIGCHFFDIAADTQRHVGSYGMLF